MSPSSPAEFVARCTIIAGPNGSGKSSLYGRFRAPGEFVNADLVARQISPDKPEDASIAAGKLVLERLRSLIDARHDFVYETTLSSHQSLNLMRDARQADFEITLIFVTLSHADLNVQRVADRVRIGGHSIPEKTIRRRHRNALHRLRNAIPLADTCLIYDNTSYEPQLLLRLQRLAVIETWLKPSKVQHLEVAQSVAAAIKCNVDDLLAADRR